VRPELTRSGGLVPRPRVAARLPRTSIRPATDARRFIRGRGHPAPPSSWSPASSSSGATAGHWS